MKNAQKQPTKEQIRLTICFTFIGCLILAAVSYNHFVDADTMSAYGGAEILGTYMMAGASAVMSAILGLASLRGMLILSGKLKTKTAE